MDRLAVRAGGVDGAGNDGSARTGGWVDEPRSAYAQIDCEPTPEHGNQRTASRAGSCKCTERSRCRRERGCDQCAFENLSARAGKGWAINAEATYLFDPGGYGPRAGWGVGGGFQSGARAGVWWGGVE